MFECEIGSDPVAMVKNSLACLDIEQVGSPHPMTFGKMGVTIWPFGVDTGVAKCLDRPMRQSNIWGIRTTMYLDNFLTEYDENLAGDSFIDPLGLLVIWSTYGHKVFESRVNSVSNDVRNYTLNLFNHYVTRRLILDEKVTLSSPLSNVMGGKNTLKFKHACLIYLENLFVYAILAHEGKKLGAVKVESAGVLGSVKARSLWNKHSQNPPLKFSPDSSSHILVRQLGLGVSGRYRTPLLTLGFFNDNYEYRSHKADLLWNKAEQQLIIPSLHALADMVHAHMVELVSQNSAKPQNEFNEIPDALRAGYASVFASSGEVGKYARPFWLDVTGLDQGAAGALLAVLVEEKGRLDMLPRDLVDLATKKAISDEKFLSGQELLKLHHIQMMEPFLAELTLLFTLLTSKRAQPLGAVIAKWREFGRTDDTLLERARQIKNDATLTDVLKGTARFRLELLLQVADSPKLADQINQVIEYHKKVMKDRDQHPWLSVDSGGQVQVHARTSTPPNAEKWPIGVWYFGYYIEQFKWLVRGFQGATN